MATASPAAWPRLAPDQQKLLLAALNSNKKQRLGADSADSNGQSSMADTDSTSEGINPAALFASISPDPFSVNSATPTAFDLNTSDSTLDFDFTNDIVDLDETSPALPYGALEGEQGEKRKSPDEDQDDDDEQDDENGEQGGKEAKKPGRKLLTSEPTTKRKAQNRAAQRAFRERKEKHLKDLETKVTDLEKASESANHENSVLRAQVERLQDELKDYRRRMSTNSTSPTSARNSLEVSRSLAGSGLDFDFNFNFPTFGGIPGTVLPSTQAIQGNSPPQAQQTGTSTASFDDGTSPGLSSHHNSVSSMPNGQSQTTPNGNNVSSSMFGSGFFDIMCGSKTQSPQPLNNSLNGIFGGAQDRPSPPNTNSSSSRSPCSHLSNGPASSCTTPDATDWTNAYNSGKLSFGDKAGSVDGRNSNTGNSNNTPGLTNAKTPNSDNFSLDFLSNQSGNFDPVLFGDYRETQNAIIGDDAFGSGFFEEGLSFPDVNDPFNFNLSASETSPAPAPTNGVFSQVPKKPNLMDQVQKQQEGNYAGAPTEKDLPMPSKKEDYSAPNMMTCHKIWNQLQNCPRFKSGDFDVDTLCSELSSKAKCTETGVAVPKEAVEAALWKLAGKPFQENAGNGQMQKLKPSPPAHTNGNTGRTSPQSEAERRFTQFMANTKH